MTRIFSFLLILSFITSALAQKQVAKLDLNYKARSYGSKESLSISNPNTGELVILIEDKNKTSVYLLDSEMNIKNTLTTDRLESTFRSFIGYQINDDNSYGIVFSDSYKKKFGVVSFNFNNNKIFQKNLIFKFNKEKYVEGITQNGVFYLMTVNKKTDDVNFYALNNNTFKKHTVSFAEITYESNGFKKKVSNILLLSSGLSRVGNLTKIDANSPNAIDNTSKKNKLYQTENELIFTFDTEKEYTRLVRVKIPEFTATTSLFEKKKLFSKVNSYESYYNHNSFLHKNTLYQISVNNSEMFFSAKNATDKSLIKEITLKKEDSITFKNGPIIQEGGSSIFAEDRVRELEKTSKFLRKISRGNTGISAYNYNNLTQITLGSYIEIQRGNGVAFGAFGGPLGSLAYTGVTATFNPTYAAYGGYTSSKSTYIDCLFDKDFNHVKGTKKENIFDKIKSFEKKFKNQGYSKLNQNESNSSVFPSMKLKNVFFHNGSHYLSYLHNKDRKYYIIEFKK